ncbi:MAG TPA: 3-isopropylmalate dehydratase small subunit [Candidatus Aphodousia gallistercoris]|nr:3-isopropylmalate dehydratase small subunit [Candidatus Aphodousia gallistercoris]
MQKFTHLTAVAAPMQASNIDTDQIIPKQFLLAVDRKGFGKHLFHGWRYLDAAETLPNPDFVLNKPCYRDAKFIVARDNFGNGSSREHAPWALLDYGIRAIIASSFADIFANNALGNGLLLVKLTEAQVEEIHQALAEHPGMEITVDLEQNRVTVGEKQYSFTLDPFRRECILNGLDTIALTLAHEAEIKAYEATIPNWRKIVR